MVRDMLIPITVRRSVVCVPGSFSNSNSPHATPSAGLVWSQGSRHAGVKSRMGKRLESVQARAAGDRGLKVYAAVAHARSCQGQQLNT